MSKRIGKSIEENPSLWRGIAIAAICFAALTIGFIVWQQLTSATMKPRSVEITDKPLVLSAKSESELWKIVKAEPLILGVQVVSVNLIKNTRSTIFFKSDVSEIQDAWDEYLTRRVATPPPVFQASAPDQNNRIAKVLNGSFDCREYKNTITFNFVPDIDKYSPWVCTISVPPSFDASGDFNGILTLYLQKEPSDIDKKNLAKTATEMSHDIFHRDIEITAK